MCSAVDRISLDVHALTCCLAGCAAARGQGSEVLHGAGHQGAGGGQRAAQAGRAQRRHRAGGRHLRAGHW